MFTDIKMEMTRDFLELRNWISKIPAEIPVGTTDDFYVISRGLFFVYVYGLYEKIIKKIVCRTISTLNSSQTPIDKCVCDLYSLAFSNEYDGLYNVGKEHKWEKRWKISEKISTNPSLNIPIEVFPTDGKNIRYRQLNSIAKSFGMKNNILPRKEVGGIIEEMVNNRNYIAHGDKTPKEIGRGYTKCDLLDRCNAISEVCSYTVGVYETYIINQEYLK